MFNVSEKLTLLIRSEPHQYQNTMRHNDAISMTPTLPPTICIIAAYSTELLVS